MRAFFLTPIAIFLIATPAIAGEAQYIGMLTGAGLGGWAGGQFGRGGGQIAAATAGVLVGGAIGDDIGRRIDNAGMPYYPSSASRALFDPGSVSFESAYTPNYVAPPAYIGAPWPGDCRHYAQPVEIDGQLRQVSGVACLLPDGSWRVVQ